MLRKRTRLTFEAFEERLVPALTFQFDYRFDASGFFNDPARRAALERAGQNLGSRIDSNLQAITPGGSNSWSAIIFNPGTGEQTTVSNLNVPAKTVVVFAGGRNLPGSQAGVGGTGGYSGNGDNTWYSHLANRGQSGFSLWGGSISFDTDTNWFTSASTAGLAGSIIDFETVAVHELGHLIGFGTTVLFDQHINGRNFNGPAAIAANGGVAPTLSSDLAHFSNGTGFNGTPASMQPYVQSGKRYGYSELDYAVLKDIGWTITAPAPTVPIVTPPTASGGTIPNAHIQPIVLTGTADGLAHTVRYINGQFVSDGVAVRPFADFNGVLRSIVADVNGDNIFDVIYATGPGGPSRFTAVNGATGQALMSPQVVFGNEFSGGLFLASADMDGDGKAEIIVSPDQGGGGRVSVFRYSGSGVIRTGDFFGIDDTTFRGGARVAAADLNGDGRPDLIVGAGFGGGPRVALFDGRTINQARPQKFVGDFFAFPGDAATKLRNGVYVSAGDINGDGKADLVFGAGPGGGPQVYVLDTAKILAGNVAAAQAAPLRSFFAFDVDDRGGVRVAVNDVDGDNDDDLIVGSGTNGAIAWYRNFDPIQVDSYSAANMFYTNDGVYIGACQCRL